MNRIWATLKIALRALLRNKLRTLLTMLGMIIGVGAVIAMVSIGNGAKSQIEASIASMGQNVVLVFSGSVTRGGVHTGWGSAGTLTLEDAEAIKREIPGVVNLSQEIMSSAPVAAGNQNWITRVLGEAPSYFDIRQWAIAEGSSFTDQDVRSANKVAVIGNTIADQLYGGSQALGQVLRIRSVPFTVVGILTAKGLSVQGQDQDDLVIIPFTSAMKRVQRATTLRGILVQAGSPVLLSPVQQQITELLRQRHHIVPGKDDDFTVRTQQEIAEMATAQSKTMTLLLGAIAMVSLVVGGIGIMNIMLVSVTERTREIGIRMAIGARGRDILLQFLTEAVTLGVLGGLVGIGVGVGVSRMLAVKMQWPSLIPAEWVFYAFIFSALVGIFFGFYPARKASRLDPIEALRYE
jgi:putative ABC transport system permease protein